VLVKGGRIVKHALARELLTRAELMTVLHRQVSPGWRRWSSAFSNRRNLRHRRKVPPLEEVQHEEVMRRLDDLSGRIDLLLQQKGGA